MLPSPKYVANFRLRNRFFRGERWIHTRRKVQHIRGPAMEKRPGGETGGENGWIFLFFCLLYIVSTFYILHLCILHSSLTYFIFCIPHLCILHSAFFTYVFYILHSSLMHSTFCILHLCILHFWRMHHVKNILHRCILHFWRMHATLYKMHVHNVICISWIVSWLLHNYTLFLLLFQS